MTHVPKFGAVVFCGLSRSFANQSFSKTAIWMGPIKIAVDLRYPS